MSIESDGSGRSHPGAGGHLGTPEHAQRTGRDSRETPLVSPRRVEKPWGHEVIWAETDDYVGKFVHVREGEALSLHFHEEKDKTLFLLRGKVTLELGAGLSSLHSVTVVEGQGFRVRPGVFHQIVALTEAEILEASTPELDDIIRVRDRYGRAALPKDGSQ